MESVFFDANPSLRQFTDNALRANNMLHKAQDREAKMKTSKTGKAASSNLSMDTGVSAEDMMGGMDLGDYRGGGSSSFESFYSQSEEQQEQADKKHKETESQISAMISSMKSSYIPTASSKEHGMTSEETKLNLPEKAEAQPSEDMNSVLNTEADAESGFTDNRKEENTSYQKYGAAEQAEVITIPEKNDSETKASSADRKASPADKKASPADKKASPADKLPSQEKAEIHKKEAGKSEKEKSKQEQVKQQAQWNSLLSFDDGFLIAPTDRFAAPDTVESSEAENEAVSFEEVELPSELDEITEQSEELIEAMLETKSISDYERAVLNSYLSSFGKRILKMCCDFGIKIGIKNYYSSLPQELSSPDCIGAYIKKEKLCLIESSSLSQKEEFVSARFYMAIAFDHALGGEDFSSKKSAAVLSSWHLCKNRTHGHLFQDVFSSLDPVHYFAQSAESYLRKEGECTDGNFFTNEELYDYDRSMFSYIEYLFKQMNRG